MKQLINTQEKAIGQALREQGWWVGNLLPEEIMEGLLADAMQLHQQGHFKPAAVGAQHNKQVVNTVRGDETCWVEGATHNQQQFLQAMLIVKNLFETYFPIPLHNFDGHYSYYPAGTFYRKHLDNARQSNHRIFSMVNYMNHDWQVGDGGELVLFDPDTQDELVCIQPTWGTTAIFFSTDFPHEVRETRKARYSLTGWFHRRNNDVA